MSPFRFGLICHSPDASPADTARRAEDVGYSTVLFPDHLGLLAPFPAMVAAAAATDTVRVGTQVLNVAFRPVGLVAQEAATVDVLSGGRLELGIGAGHAADELRQVGLPFDTASRRIKAVGASVPLLRQAFGGATVTASGAAGTLDGFHLEPLPPQGRALPIMIGGNGDAMLRTAAEHADIVQFMGFSRNRAGVLSVDHFTWDGLLDRVALVRAAAGERRPELSLMAQCAIVTDDRAAALAELPLVRGGIISAEVAADSPFLFVGSTSRVADQLTELRERTGISYVTVFVGQSVGFDDVVRHMTTVA